MALHDIDLTIPLVDPNTGLATEHFQEWLRINKKDKANRVEDGTENNIVILDSTGQPKDSSASLPDGDIADTSSPQELQNKTFAELVASKLLASNGSGGLQETDLSGWIAGTSGKLTVTDDGDGTVTLSVSLKANSGLTSDANGIYPLLKPGYGINVDSTGLQLIQQANETDASESHTITDPGDAPATADALRDDLVANTIPSIESALNALGVKINAALAILLNAEIMAGP